MSPTPFSRRFRSSSRAGFSGLPCIHMAHSCGTAPDFDRTSPREFAPRPRELSCQRYSVVNPSREGSSESDCLVPPDIAPVPMSAATPFIPALANPLKIEAYLAISPPNLANKFKPEEEPATGSLSAPVKPDNKPDTPPAATPCGCLGGAIPANSGLSLLIGYPAHHISYRLCFSFDQSKYGDSGFSILNTSD